ncbi:cobyrinate a,c-diamide synthase [Cytophagaceae bacterium YF14B1]|uniref:Cobyrinate a,c-diamide synthase n=1 Tax=Xanthocytophaga flava TaxID=3048013 RepID=A0AAE3QWE2_9BACT|nr:cobyrinate a,c-diamide synthase [Xanthocytophaga flavus]MDJ1484465.1 cobyrinate a,c-diamide synthase [Xanthocytophaga flavus]
MKPQFLIAAPSSSSGKTTLTLGLLKALSLRGYKVQPFKCGPDYLDTKHHTLAASQQSINLDAFMMSQEHIHSLYRRNTQNADIAVVEGVMGLFDGAYKMQGSSAEMAILLDLPVILVVNAKAMAYSVAPLLHGFKTFDSRLKIAGVIFNFVTTESHYQFLKEACEDVKLESLGYIPANPEISIPSRHLGLSVSSEHNYLEIIEKAALHIEKTVQIDRLVDLCTSSISTTQTLPAHTPNIASLKIAVAQDEAFNFTYPENLQVLKQLGQVTFFSPLRDTILPEADLIYLPGGYPELHLKALSENISLRNALLAYCQNNGYVLAECGGMMYLGKSIINAEGKECPMTGFLDITTSMQHAKLSLGYRSVYHNDNIYKGHEFHYSIMTTANESTTDIQVKTARLKDIDVPVYRKNNVLASYIHFYWGEDCSLLYDLVGIKNLLNH